MSPTTKSTVRILGTVLALLLVLAAALSGVAQAARHSETTTHPLPPDVAVVELANEVGDVTVTAVGAGEEPRVVVTWTGSFQEPNFAVRGDGDAASLTGGCPSTVWFGPCEVAWELFVPAAAELSVHNDVGDVTVSGTSGTVTATTDVGQVRATDVAGGTLDLRSAVGDVVADVDTPPSLLTARTDTGDVRVTVPDDGTRYRVRAATSLGEVRTTVPVDDAAEHTLDLLTSLGDVTVRPG